MAEALENVTDLEQFGSTAKQLVEVRKQLASHMLVRCGGFEYELIFGGGADAVSAWTGEIPHVLVRVELRQFQRGFYRFEIFVDFNLPVGIGVSLKEAEHYKRAVDNAVKRAKWAQKLVFGHVWDQKAVMSLEVV